MNDLAGRRIMIVEDSFLLAMEMKDVLERAGAEVIGPFEAQEKALASLGEALPDCAVLDVNLGGGPSFDLARTLRRRGIPFLFFTGYDASVLPPEFCEVQRLEKPVDTARLLRSLRDCCRAGM